MSRVGRAKGLVFRPDNLYKGMRFRHTRSAESTWPDAQRAWEEALGAYLVRRFGLMLLTLFGISVIIFMLLRLTPGNIADILFDAGGFVDPADKARIEAELGLDKPIPVQYVDVDRRAVARRSRHLVPDRTAGDRGDRAAHPDHRQARRPRADLFGADRRAARGHQRGASRIPGSITSCGSSACPACRCRHSGWGC